MIGTAFKFQYSSTKRVQITHWQKILIHYPPKETHWKMVGPLIQNQKTCMSINFASTTLSCSFLRTTLSETNIKEIGKTKQLMKILYWLIIIYKLLELHKRIKIPNSTSTSHTLRKYISVGGKYYKSITSNYKEKKKGKKEQKENWNKEK